MPQISIRVLGKPWKLRLFTRKKFNKKHDKFCVAITNINKRRIDFSPDGVDKETIVHELVHAYLGEFCLYSTDLDVDNLEEIFAEMMAKRGQEILDKSASLLKKLRSK